MNPTPLTPRFTAKFERVCAEAKVTANVRSVRDAKFVLLVTNLQSSLLPSVKELHRDFYLSILQFISFQPKIDELYLPSQTALGNYSHKIWDATGLGEEEERLQKGLQTTSDAISHLVKCPLQCTGWKNHLNHLVALYKISHKTSLTARDVFNTILGDDQTKTNYLQSTLIRTGNQHIEQEIITFQEKTLALRQKKFIETLEALKTTAVLQDKKVVIVAEKEQVDPERSRFLEQVQKVYQSLKNYDHITLNPIRLKDEHWKEIFPEYGADCLINV